MDLRGNRLSRLGAAVVGLATLCSCRDVWRSHAAICRRTPRAADVGEQSVSSRANLAGWAGDRPQAGPGRDVQSIGVTERDVRDVLNLHRGKRSELMSAFTDLYARHGVQVLLLLGGLASRDGDRDRIEALRALHAFVGEEWFPLAWIARAADQELARAERVALINLLDRVPESRMSVHLHCQALTADLGPKGLSLVLLGLFRSRSAETSAEADECVRLAFVNGNTKFRWQILSEFSLPVFDNSGFQLGTLAEAERIGDAAMREFARSVRTRWERP